MKNVLLLISGTTVAQAIPILIAPILTRLYSPADFGVLAVFMALTSIVGGIANGRYETAIILPEQEEDAINLGVVGACIALVVSFMFFLCTLLLQEQIVVLLDNKQIASWLYLFPISSLLIGISSILYQFNLRDKNYSNLTMSTVTRSITQSAVQLGIGLLKPGEFGLIIGQFLSYAAGNSVLLPRNRSRAYWRSVINVADMWRLAKRYADFPKFSIWATLSNTLSYNLINMIISGLFSVTSLGFYAIVNRVLGMPMTVVGEAIGQVFQRKARDEKTTPGGVNALFKRTLFRLTLLSLPLFALLYWWSEELFLFVFGEEWVIAGTYARLLIPLFFIRFISVPVMFILNLYEKQRVTLMWQVGLLMQVILAAVLAKSFAVGIETFFMLLTSLLVLHYVILLFILYRLSIGESKEGQKMKGHHCCLVLNGYVNGYSIIRELHEQGVKDIILFDTKKNLAAYSRRIKKFVLHEATVPALKQALEDLHLEYEKIIVFPTSEGQMEQLYELREQIADYCFLPFNQENLLESISKITQYAHCQKAGVPYPQSVFLFQPSDLAQVSSLPFPVIVKPSHRDSIQNDVFRHLVVKTKDEWIQHEDLLRELMGKGITFLASEIIPGDSANIYAYTGYRDMDGNFLNEWVGKKLSQYPNHYGVFASASNQAPPEILHQGRALMESMNLYGICEPEFKYDPRDGTYKLMEINLRSTMWNRIGCLSGVHILYTQYLNALGQKVEKEEQVRSRDIHFVYFKYECLGMLKGTIPFRVFWKNIFLSDKTGFAVFDLYDMKPFMADFFSIFPNLARKAVNLAKRVWRMKHEKHTNLGSPT